MPVTPEGVSRAWRLRAAAAAAPALSATASLPPTELERLAFAVCGEIAFALARDVSGRRRAVTPDMSGLRPSFGAFGSVTRFVQLEPSYRVRRAAFSEASRRARCFRSRCIRSK